MLKASDCFVNTLMRIEKKEKEKKLFRDNSIIIHGILQVPQLSVSDGDTE